MWQRSLLNCNHRLSFPHARPRPHYYPTIPRASRTRRHVSEVRSYSTAIRLRRPLQNSIGANILATASVCICVGASLYLYQFGRRRVLDPTETIVETTISPPEGLETWIMSQETPSGRVGTLTPDQEAKLQEFWKAVLKVFGVPLSDVASVSEDPTGDAEAEEIEEEEEVTDNKTGEKKKRRFGILRRKKKESKENKDSKSGSKDVKGEKNAASAHDMPSGDAEDKYGQTKEFKLALAENSPSDLRHAFWSMVKHDNPDSLLLRFLRARKWDIEKALIMMISTMHWRLNEQHVDDDIMKNGELGSLLQSRSSDPDKKKAGEDFMTQLRLGKSFIHGIDERGRPICIVRVRLHKQGEQGEPSLERFTVHVIETARLLLLHPVDTATIVFDMTGFSLANMDYTPVKFMIKCFEANYPESLGAVLVHKAPWVFQGIWKIIRGWLDPVVAGKVHFTNDLHELEAFIPRSRIISELGGDEEYVYKYPEPQLEENDAMKDTATRDRLLEARAGVVKQYEDATKEWIRSSPNDASVRSKRNAIAEELRTGYWELDPYVRARSMYDRTGVIGKGGVLTFYPKEIITSADAEKSTPATEAPSEVEQKAAKQSQNHVQTAATAGPAEGAVQDGVQEKPDAGPTPAGHDDDALD